MVHMGGAWPRISILALATLSIALDRTLPIAFIDCDEVQNACLRYHF